MFVHAAKAFIVYHNKDNLCDQVLYFADFLHFFGITCDIPAYHLQEDIINWSNFIEKQIKCAEYILLVCTKELNYLLRSQSHCEVRMTQLNGPHILNSTLNSLLKTKFTLPIILELGSKKYVPTNLQETKIYTVSFDGLPDFKDNDQDSVKGMLDTMPQYTDLRSLVAKLLDQQEYKQPKVAPHPPDFTSKIFCTVEIT